MNVHVLPAPFVSFLTGEFGEGDYWIPSMSLASFTALTPSDA